MASILQILEVALITNLATFSNQILSLSRCHCAEDCDTALLSPLLSQGFP